MFAPKEDFLDPYAHHLKTQASTSAASLATNATMAVDRAQNAGTRKLSPRP